MTFVRDFIFALAAALVLTAVLATAWGLPRLRHRFVVWPFLMLFLAAWAGGVWLSPLGPRFFGGYVLPFFIVAFVIALVIAASTHPGRRASVTGAPADDLATASLVGASVFLWVVVFSLLAAIVVYYLMG
jgi:hypothetical protein